MLSQFSSNAILSKARAMYGKRLTAADYQALLTCQSVGEVAAYLKQRTVYAQVLSGVNELTIHRGQLESLLKKSCSSTSPLWGGMSCRWGSTSRTTSSPGVKSSRSSTA